MDVPTVLRPTLCASGRRERPPAGEQSLAGPKHAAQSAACPIADEDAILCISAGPTQPARLHGTLATTDHRTHRPYCRTRSCTLRDYMGCKSLASIYMQSKWFGTDRAQAISGSPGIAPCAQMRPHEAPRGRRAGAGKAAAARSSIGFCAGTGTPPARHTGLDGGSCLAACDTSSFGVSAAAQRTEPLGSCSATAGSGSTLKCCPRQLCHPGKSER